MVSLWCKLLCKLLIYTLKSDQWITIRLTKFELECLLLIFIHSNSKLKVACKNADFKCRYFRIHAEGKKMSKIPNITFIILPFSHKYTSIKFSS